MSVIYEGKGSQEVLVYHFQDPPRMGPQEPRYNVNHPLLQRMVECRISTPVAVRLLSQLSEEHVIRRLRLADQILASGFSPKNSGAFWLT
ncbi:hypothetical protein FNU79_15090 [Deinococcus detaillensis]|uniref:Uncharacterized protein n=1 Tax=Deinococcus detaillensis TaxID=2592048 RepID=A0A553UMN4_9DEIO|nr:hypothetical protein [Deinococcus detaillensis]TSA81453.1 hypothetical protein FNU79_15090 [Deinococcus detaillensis]